MKDPIDSILRKSRYNISRTLNRLDRNIREINGDKFRILFITPHLSTGGMPQYLYKKIEILSDYAEIYCIQYENTAEAYVVQRNLIRDKLRSNFICLDSNKTRLLYYIDEICPDIIHFEDFVEFFIDEKIINNIYTEDRPYFIFETCHSSNVSPADKIYVPDKFVMVNQWMANKFSILNVPVDILEYPIENFDRPDRKIALEFLGLDSNKKHVVNIGLFTPGKNQGELISYARNLIDYPIEFHFIGNTAPNFKNYWLSILKDLPHNCRLWGERNDVDNFYKCADLFVFTSKWELNPIVIKESLSWKLPILMRKLEPYMDFYDDNPLVYWINNNSESYNERFILEILGL